MTVHSASRLNIERLSLASLLPDPANPRIHDSRNIAAIQASLREHGQVEPLVVRAADRMVIGGNGRMEAMAGLGWVDAECVLLDVDGVKARRLSIALNRTGELAGWDLDVLQQHLDELAETDGWDGSADLGFDPGDLDALVEELNPPSHRYDTGRPGGLVTDFGAPPFTVLDSRQGYWQSRKRWWLNAGLLAAEGRENLADTNSSASLQAAAGGSRGAAAGGSAFDPVLAELSCRWFCPPGGSVLDPFAGEAVKGIVAAACGYQYTGVEIRQEQVDANDAQWAVCSERHGWEGQAPNWVCGDSQQIDNLLPDGALYDCAFTSPPYYDLEVYSDRSGDGSALQTYEDFMAWYADIFTQVVGRLRENAFVVVKVGEIRDRSTGAYRGFVPDNIRLFTGLGLHFYNDAILVTPAGTAPLRVRSFRAARKMVKVHQNVLVFWKGDLRKVGDTLGEVPASNLLDPDAE